MNTLPANATIESQRRYQLAQRIAAEYPLQLGEAIALTGSASRGCADADSDVEINYWLNQIPTYEQRTAWLYSIGATYVSPDQPWTADTAYSIYTVEGITVESLWQPVAGLARDLEAILRGEQFNHVLLELAEVVATAIPLRDEGLLQNWQARLAHYPLEIQERLINSALSIWLEPRIVQMRWVMAARGQSIALMERLVRDTHNILRILWAINQQWEPDWKWIPQLATRLTTKPDHLAERIDTIFTDPSLKRRVAVHLQLVADSLALVPSHIDVAYPLSVVQQSLQANIGKHGM